MKINNFSHALIKEERFFFIKTFRPLVLAVAFTVQTGGNLNYGHTCDPS